jgi:hypothetical protein
LSAVLVPARQRPEVLTHKSNQANYPQLHSLRAASGKIPDLRGRPDIEGKHRKIPTLQFKRLFNWINPECPDAGVDILGADPIKGTQPLEETP